MTRMLPVRVTKDQGMKRQRQGKNLDRGKRHDKGKITEQEPDSGIRMLLDESVLDEEFHFALRNLQARHEETGSSGSLRMPSNLTPPPAKKPELGDRSAFQDISGLRPSQILSDSEILNPVNHGSDKAKVFEETRESLIHKVVDDSGWAEQSAFTPQSAHTLSHWDDGSQTADSLSGWNNYNHHFGDPNLNDHHLIPGGLEGQTGLENYQDLPLLSPETSLWSSSNRFPPLEGNNLFDPSSHPAIYQDNGDAMVSLMLGISASVTESSFNFSILHSRINPQTGNMP